jgi:hypothetical protein
MTPVLRWVGWCAISSAVHLKLSGIGRRIFRRGLMALTLILSGRLLRAQTPASRAASLEGDVYLVMQDGDTKKGAGGKVFLVRKTPGIIADLKATCAQQTRELSPRIVEVGELVNFAKSYPQLAAKYTDSAAALMRHIEKRTSDYGRERRLLMQAFAVDSARTGVNARYRFARVRPGDYIVFHQWTIGTTQHQWLTPVTLEPGRARTLDLDNEAKRDHVCAPP